MAGVTFAVGEADAVRYFAKSSESEFVVKIAEWSVKPLLEKTRADIVKKH